MTFRNKARVNRNRQPTSAMSGQASIRQDNSSLIFWNICDVCIGRPLRMRIVLVVPRDEFSIVYCQFPVGALYTATLLNVQHSVEIVDLRIQRIAEAREIIASADLIILFTVAYERAQCYPV